MKLTGIKIWNSKNVSLCRVFSNRVTYSHTYCGFNFFILTTHHKQLLRRLIVKTLDMCSKRCRMMLDLRTLYVCHHDVLLPPGDLLYMYVHHSLARTTSQL